MAKARFAVDGRHMNANCTNTLPSVQGADVDAFVGCEACITPFRNTRSEPCLDPSRHKDDMPRHYYTIVSGGYDPSTFIPNYPLTPVFGFPTIDLANSFPFPPFGPGVDPNTLTVDRIGYAHWFHNVQRKGRGPILFWGGTGGAVFTNVYPDISCGFTANRLIGTDSLGSGNLGYGSRVRYFGVRDEWDIEIELQTGQGEQLFLPTDTIADVAFNPHANRDVYEEPWQLAFNDGSPTLNGIFRVEMIPWYNNNANDVLALFG